MLTKLTLDKNRIIKIALWVVTISLIATNIPQLFNRQEGGSSAVAIINGYNLDRDDLQRKIAQEVERLASIKNRLGAQANTLLEAMGLGDPSKVAFDALTTEILLNEVSDAAKIVVSPLFIEHSVKDPSFVIRHLLDIIPLSVIEQDGHINIQALQHYLKMHKQSTASFEAAIEQKVARVLVANIVDSTVMVLPQEIRDAFEQKFRLRSYELLTLPYASYYKKLSSEPIAPQKLENFYREQNAQAKRYWKPEVRSATIIAFDPLAYGIQVSQQEIERYYEQNKAAFVSEPTKISVRNILFAVSDDAKPEVVKEKEAQARLILKALQEDPATFAEVAKKNSDDKVTAAHGGLIDSFSKGSHNAEFERAAFRLAHDGDISDVIVTDKGFEIIQRVSRKPIVYKSLAEATPLITERLIRQKFHTAFNNDANRLLHSAHNEDRLQTFVETKKGERRSTGFIAKDNSIMAKKMFSARPGQWNFYVSDNKGYLIKLQEIQKSYQPQLSDVQETVTEDYLRKEAHHALKKDLELAKKMSKDSSLASLAEKFNATIRSVKMVSPEQPGALADDPNSDTILALYKQESVSTFFDGNNGSVIAVVAVGPFDDTLFQENYGAIEKSLYSERKTLVQRGFIASLTRNATILYKDNPTA